MSHTRSYTQFFRNTFNKIGDFTASPFRDMKESIDRYNQPRSSARMGGGIGICIDKVMTDCICGCSITKACASAIVKVPFGVSTAVICGLAGIALLPIPAVLDAVESKPASQSMPATMTEQKREEIIAEIKSSPALSM